MIISETCIEDAAEFNIDNADHKVCMTAYKVFLRDHRKHEGHTDRMDAGIAIFRTMTIPKVPKT